MTTERKIELLKRSLKELIDHEFAVPCGEYNVCGRCGIPDYKAHRGSTGAPTWIMVYEHFEGCQLAQLIADLRKELGIRIGAVRP